MQIPDSRGHNDRTMHALTPQQNTRSTRVTRWTRRHARVIFVEEAFVEAIHLPLEHDLLTAEDTLTAANTTSTFYQVDTSDSESITMDDDLPTTIDPALISSPGGQPATPVHQLQYPHQLLGGPGIAAQSNQPNVNHLAVAHLDPTALNSQRGYTAFAHQHHMAQYLQSARTQCQKHSHSSLDYAPAQQPASVPTQSYPPSQTYESPTVNALGAFGANNSNEYNQQHQDPMQNTSIPTANSTQTPLPQHPITTKDFNWYNPNRVTLATNRPIVYNGFIYTKEEACLIVALHRYLNLDADTCAGELDPFPLTSFQHLCFKFMPSIL